MGLYDRFILPHVIELAMRQKNFAPFRERVVGAARGRVLEVGIGSGLNLASYRTCAEEVYAVDPSTELLAKASNRLNTSRIRRNWSKVQARNCHSTIADSIRWS
jgi:protein-L-isoaspartate O-methyltransferase